MCKTHSTKRKKKLKTLEIKMKHTHTNTVEEPQTEPTLLFITFFLMSLSVHSAVFY